MLNQKIKNMKRNLLFLTVMLMGLGAMAQTTYTKINSESELSAGDKVLIVGFNDDGQAFAMSYQKSNNRHAIEIANAGGSITTEVAASASSQTEPFEITIGGSAGAWTFFDALNNGYLYAPGGGNYLKTQSTLDDKGKWTFSMEGDGFVPTSNGGAEQKIMRYNVASTLFGCYKPSSSVTGLVYIYKEGGAPVIDPEPSNYPTNVHSSHHGVNVTLEWTDATGEQLPLKYLVVASTGNIAVPTDGTPVADSPLAKNVAYGVETVTFTGLEASTTYNIAIFPYTNSGTNIDYKTDGNYPTATETTDDYKLLLSADFANSLAPFTAYNVKGEQEWTTGAYQGMTYAKMSGYANQTNNENEDWLISPDLLNGSTCNEMEIGFMNAYKYNGDPLKVLYTENYDGVSNPNNFSWNDITGNFEWSEGEFAWVSTTYTMENMQDMSHIFIAFKYTSTTAASSTWEIANVMIYAQGYTSVGENSTTSFNLYPNPASSRISISAEKDCEIQITDMAGRIVMAVNAVEGENNINVADLESGVYFVRMNDAVVKFVKK